MNCLFHMVIFDSEIARYLGGHDSPHLKPTFALRTGHQGDVFPAKVGHAVHGL